MARYDPESTRNFEIEMDNLNDEKAKQAFT